MTILFQRALLLAKVESVFQTDAVPVATLKSVTVVDATTDVDDTTEIINDSGTGQMTAHPFTDGELIQVSIDTGALPGGLTIDTDYYVEVETANSISLHLTRAAAIAKAAPIDLTDAVGTFTIARQTSDAFLVIDPVFAPDVTVLDRVNVKQHLSTDPGVTARKIATVTFQHEIRGNGVTTGLDAPMLGVLLRGCGMSETRFGEAGSTEETILDDTALPVNEPTGVFDYTKTTGYVGTEPRTVVIVAEGSGGSGTLFSVFSPAVGSVQAATSVAGQALTDNATFALPESAVITIGNPGVTTNFVAGDTYVIHLSPAGHFYEPVSDAFDSLTIYVYYDGLLHKLTGCRGTFTAEAAAGEFGTFSFTFTGDFINATDVAIPTNAVFETIVPNQTELAAVSAYGGQDIVEPIVAADVGEINLCAQSVSVDIGNEVVPRECINAENSLEGGIITSRNPTAAFNPETELEATHPFWANLSAAERIIFDWRQGREQGNIVAFTSIYAQYTNVTYANRNEIRAYDVTLRLATDSTTGNDELRIVFS